MEMNPETIKALLDAFEDSEWREMTVTIGSDVLHVSRDGSTNGHLPAPATAPAPAPPAQLPAPAEEHAPEPAPAPTAPAPAVAAPVTGTVIESPSVGLFWRAPSPSAPPFVEVGARVASGDTVAIVEVMKLMNHVVAPVDGVVVAIHVDNGAMVEFGQPLIVVDPEG
jgi:acetyl-CoA carboxylase biotin carboxyl carrier protein